MSNINVNNITPLAGTSGTVSISGSLFVTGSITAEGEINLGDSNLDSVNFVADVSSSIIPDATDTYNLGQNHAKRWKTVFAQTGSFERISGSVEFSDTLTVNGLATLDSASIGKVSSSLIPDKDDHHSLGSSGLQWKDLHLDGRAFIDTIDPSVAISGISSSLEISGSITPKTDSLHNLGSNSLKFKQVFVSSASIDAMSSSLIPINDSQFALGASNQAWSNLFVDAIDLAGQGNISIGGSGRIDLDSDDDTSIRASADDTITIEVAGTDQLNITDGVIAPETTNDVDLGSTSKEFKNLHLAGTASIGVLTDIGASPTVDVSASLVPLMDGAFDLGSSTNEWNNLFLDGTANIDNFDATGDGVISGSLTFASGSTLSLATTVLAATDAAHYTIHGSKVEVRNQLHAQLDDGAFAALELRNDTIASDSIVLGSFTGNTAGQITGSIITAATTGAKTASIQIHNETGANIANDTTFTASFVVIG